MATRVHPVPRGRSARSRRRALQVGLATTLVAGCPVAVVWWLRESGTVTSTPLALGIGMGLSLLASWAGQAVWEKLPSSEDLLFNELMVWGYVQRLRKQRRLADAASLIESESAEARRQRRLLERLVSAMETRDPYLHGHSRRVARHSWAIAQRMKLPREEVARIRAAATLHDVGKTKTPKTILHKPGKLTDEEYRIIKLHPGEGAEMTAVLRDRRLDAMIRHHHERLDGSGYPDGLKGDSIPLGARIIAVADTFDAITSARPYRDASPHKKAIDILREEAGTRLDPDVVKAFCGNYAGRGPLALWSFVSALPERLVTWLSSSVGAVASAAKVVAVAAIVGGAAATSSTLGLAGFDTGSHPRRHGSARAAAAHLTPASGAGSSASGVAGLRAAGPSLHSRARRRAVHGAPGGPGTRSAGETSPGATTPVGSAPVAAGESRSGPSAGGGEERRPSHEEAGGKSEEPKAGKEERPAKKSEEPSVAAGEEHGKGSESTGQSRREEATSSAPGGSESPGSGAGGESPGAGTGGKGAPEVVGKASAEAPGSGGSAGQGKH